MEKGVVCGIDTKRVYIRTSIKSACKFCKVKHLCLESKKNTRVIPVVKRLQHSKFKLGDHVHFEISQRQTTAVITFLYGFPILGLIVGLFVGNIATGGDEFGILWITSLFLLLTFYGQHIIGKRTNFLRELDVHLDKSGKQASARGITNKRKANNKIKRKKAKKKNKVKTSSKKKKQSRRKRR